jgi:hypothetical protein
VLADDTNDSFLSLPNVGSTIATAGDSSATSSYNLREESGQTILDWNLDHAVDDSFGSGALTIGSIQFIAVEDASYSISAQYDFTAGMTANQWVSLEDYTAGILLLSSDDQGNTVFGSTTGTLTAGHTYNFNFRYEIYNYQHEDLGATAIGDLNLTIGETAAVPERASLAIWGLGALGCVIGAYRRRTVAA